MAKPKQPNEAARTEDLQRVLEVWRRLGGQIAEAIPEGRDGQRYGVEKGKKAAQTHSIVSN